MEKFRLTEEEYNRLVSFRHDMHMYPELSGREVKTTEKIRKFLSKLPGCSILDMPIKTGVVAQMKGDPDAQEIMLRADIDALPQTEQVDISWKSRIDGVMHACGHDVHTASLLGAALLVSRRKRSDALKNTVDFVFQPAEEGTTGARAMIDAGLFERIHPNLCFGLHNWPSVGIGKVVCLEGARMSAKRNFDICIHGRGGHGSMPHLNTDPVVCAAAVIQSLQTIISRNTDPLDAAILSVNRIEGGSPVNLVVDKVVMKATVRSLSRKALDRAIERVNTIVEKTAQAYECESGITWKECIPAVWNTPEMTNIAKRCVRETESTLTDAPPSLASEDFALYREYVPSFHYWVGSRSEGKDVNELHTPRFFADDEVIRYAAELYAACAGLRS